MSYQLGAPEWHLKLEAGLVDSDVNDCCYSFMLVCYDSTNDPSHGGAYMVEGRLSLGSDWLVVISEPRLLFSFIALPRIVPVRCINLLTCLGLRGALVLLSVLLSGYRCVKVFHSTAYMVFRIP